MLNCKKASQLASQAMDGKLPRVKHMMLKMHLLLCRSCANFSRQLAFLRAASYRFRHSHELRLTDDAKQRIARAIDSRKPSD